MSALTQPTITESELLATFLLTPSPMPTIIPYTTFLTLVPQSYRNSPEYAPSLKRLYQDLQFQRSITVDQVRINIKRECSSRAATLRARLTRRIAIEGGNQFAEREEAWKFLETRKRKRDNNAFIDRRDDENEDEALDLETKRDEFTDERELDAQRAFHGHESMFHPAAHVLSFEEGSKRREAEANNAAFHTERSLLRCMDVASDSLAREIAELEGECAKLGAQMKETIEGLSDLKYGKSRTSREQENGTQGEEGSAYAEVMSALNTFQDLLRSKTQKSSLAVS